jgi:hypothetical protein
MPLGSTTAKNWALDACYGSNHSSVWPSTVYVALFNGNPSSGGTELTSTGNYARVALTNNSTNFPDASSGFKSNGTDIAFPTSTGAYSASATYIGLYDNSAGGNLLDYGALSPTLTVSGASQTPKIPAGALQIGQP